MITHNTEIEDTIVLCEVFRTVVSNAKNLFANYVRLIKFE